MRDLTPTEKGAVAEMAVASAATQLGIVVSRPLTEGRRYDLSFDLRGRLLRIQCKWGALRGDVVAVGLRTSRRRAAEHVRSVSVVRATCTSAALPRGTARSGV